MPPPISPKMITSLTLTLLFITMPTMNAWHFFQMPQPGNNDAPITLEDAVETASAEELNSSTDFLSQPAGVGEDMDLTKDPWWSFYSFIIDPEVMDKGFPSYLKRIILYKPPVGITSLYVAFKLIIKRRKLVESMMIDRSQGVEPKSSRKYRKRTGRSLDLDKNDSNYEKLGGVEAVRAQLCIAALCEFIKGDDSEAQTTERVDHRNNVETPILDNDRRKTSSINNSSDFPDKATFVYFAAAAIEALGKYSVPNTSREYFVEMSVGPMGRLEKLYKSVPTTTHTKSSNNNKGGDGKIGEANEINSILWIAAKVAEIRTLDALLRVLRERLLTSAMRLTRKEKLRAMNLRWYESNIGRIWSMGFRQMVRGKTLTDDRRNFQLTSAALKREMERLGQVQIMLLTRPEEMSETRLLMASSRTVDEILENDSINETNTTSMDCAGQIDGKGASYVLLSAAETPSNSVGRSKKGNGFDMWTMEAHSWTRRTRELIRDLLEETFSVVDQTKRFSELNSSVGDDLHILSLWARYDVNRDKGGWSTVLSLVDDLSKVRLLRERKYLPSAIDVRYWVKRLDFFGIPSSLAIVGASVVLHKIIKPYRNDIVTVTKLIFGTIWGIIEFRFWAPLRDITLDLLNRRRPKLLDPFSLGSEETSLDNMLRDLGVGDGTKTNRGQALAAALKMYEQQMAEGPITNLLRGRMVHLLLIQIQQVKAGMLEAMGSIDDLVDSNRLNVQLLAIIPAYLLVSLGTRLFFTALYSLRSREFVGLPAAHSEMSDILSTMERCLLLASRSNDMDDSPNHDDNGIRMEESHLESTNNVLLQPKELGNFVLLMHSYLVILDYCCPPFASKACDSIHAGMQDLLLPGQLITRRQIALLQVSFSINLLVISRSLEKETMRCINLIFSLSPLRQASQIET